MQHAAVAHERVSFDLDVASGRLENAAVTDLARLPDPNRAAAKMEVRGGTDPRPGADREHGMPPGLRLDDDPGREASPVAEPDREAAGITGRVRPREHERVADEDDTVSDLDSKLDPNPGHPGRGPACPHSYLKPPPRGERAGKERLARGRLLRELPGRRRGRRSLLRRGWRRDRIRHGLERRDVGGALVLSLDVVDRGRVHVDRLVAPGTIELRKAPACQLLGDRVRRIADGHLLSVLEEDPRRHGAILTSGHGRKNRHLVAVLDRGLEPVEEADVLTLDVDVDEPAQVTVLGNPLLEAVETVVEAVEDLADRGRLVDDRLTLATGDAAELRRDLDRHTHAREFTQPRRRVQARSPRTPPATRRSRASRTIRGPRRAS